MSRALQLVGKVFPDKSGTESSAVDLGVALALTSSFLDRPLPPDTLIFGEIGLTGEIRAVSQPEVRL